jgi:putative transposase
MKLQDGKLKASNWERKEAGMPGRIGHTIELSEQSRPALEKLVKGHTTGQQIALRARMILAAAEGKGNRQIGRELAVHRETVRLWRKRWVSLAPIPLSELSVAERLEDLPRPGAPARITAEQRCQMEAVACEAPEQAGRPISQWSAREIADELIKRNIVQTISPRHAARLFKRSGYSSAQEPLLVNHGEGRSLCQQEQRD